MVWGVEPFPLAIHRMTHKREKESIRTLVSLYNTQSCLSTGRGDDVPANL